MPDDLKQLDSPEAGERGPLLPLVEKVALPPFPVGCLPEPLRAYAQAAADSFQVPVDMVCTPMLAVLAACLQGRFRVHCGGDWYEPLNLYTLVVAAPAERKSAVMAAICKPIFDYQDAVNELQAPEIARNKAEKALLDRQVKSLLERASKDASLTDELMSKQAEAFGFKELHPLLLVCDNVTPEALTSLLAIHGGKMAMISAEGGIFDILGGSYSKTVNLDVFLKAHSGDYLGVDRVGRGPERIAHPALTMALAIQPEVLRGVMGNQTFRGRGLTARFLYSLPTSKVGRRLFEVEPIPPEVQEGYDRLIGGLLSEGREADGVLLHLSPEAREVSRQFYDDLEPRLADDLADLGGWAGKLHGAVMRVAGLLHVAEHGTVFAVEQAVSDDTMLSAVMLGYYFTEHAQGAFQLMGADDEGNLAQYVVNQIRRKGADVMSRREIFNICRGRIKTVEELLPILDRLEECNYIRLLPAEPLPLKRPGQPPSPKYEVNPNSA